MAPKKGSGSGNPVKNNAPSKSVVQGFVQPGAKQNADGKKKDDQNPSPTPRAEARKIIGGASWTGKLPVALLSEHCQRQKGWNAPEYRVHQVPGKGDGVRKHRSFVVLSRTDPKTQEVTKLNPLQLPPSHAHLAEHPTALEARHFAAAYALFRVQSMKNLAMALPPHYRALWKGEFQQLKDADLQEGNAWKYEADPFAAEAKRQEIKVANEKRRQAQAAQASKSEPDRLVGGPGQRDMKEWDHAPRIELGPVSRGRMETLVSSRSIWNRHSASIPEKERETILSTLSQSGFQPRHVEEALEFGGSREEVLEWLLLHVPEDSLPAWSFPKGYNAGAVLATANIATEAKLKRLMAGGYPPRLCSQVLRDKDGDERITSESLQERLFSPHVEPGSEGLSDVSVWEEEMTTLAAVFDDRFSSTSSSSCTVQTGPEAEVPATFLFHLPERGYPALRAPVVVIMAPQLPSYICLSITKKAVTYAQDHLLGEAMIYHLVEHLSDTMPAMIATPDRLSDLKVYSSWQESRPGPGQMGPGEQRIPKRTAKGRVRDTRSSKAILEEWLARQASKPQERMNLYRRGLPAWKLHGSIVETIRRSQVTLITGETGSGKSTQAIQYILDDAIENLQGAMTNILCTQPRRVAAVSLAERVNTERCGQGDEVGYIIRGDAKVSPLTKITFVTTGVLLRRLQGSRSVQEALHDVSHVFVDEVHERSLDTDFLLALLRDALPSLPRLKVVMLSATVDADLFAHYFSTPHPVARVHIEGRTFPVQDYYLDDVMHMVRPEGSGETWKTGSRSRAGDAGNRSLGGGIDYQLIVSLVAEISRNLDADEGGILVFLPGTVEIDRCLRMMSDLPSIHGLPLHASLTAAEQRRVFDTPPPNKRKVVVSTNIAETSITIDDIVVVIDSGRVKETRYDPTSNMVRLEETWASRAACKQRRGRVGRVRAGSCYKLFSHDVEARMAAAALPEMQRTSLAQLCLSVKATGSGRDVREFLAGVLSPPDTRAVDTAMTTLHRMGALENDRLTGLGTYLTMIPADLKCAKLLVYGVLFDCVEPCLTVAAILATRSPFLSPRDKQNEAREARMAFPAADGDLLLDLEAYRDWKVVASTERKGSLREWCESRFLSQQGLRDIDSTRRQLSEALVEAGLLVLRGRQREVPAKDAGTDSSLLRALIATALHPQVARIQLPEKKYIASMSGAKELDPEARSIRYYGEDRERVFVHPSSALFGAQAFSGNATFLSYFTKMATTKTFIRDLTPLNAYGLLLFGGPIAVDTSGMGIIIDGWLRLRGWARIGVLASRLRTLLDEELRRRIDGPLLADGAEDELFGIVRHLLDFNGQDQ